MLILKNVTAVQLHPAKVQEGVDIAIENDVIVAIGDALTQRYPDFDVRNYGYKKLTDFLVGHMANENWPAEQARAYFEAQLPKLDYWKQREK